MPTALIAPLVGSLASAALGGLFGGGGGGGGGGSSAPTIANINAGGLTSNLNNGVVSISPSSDRSSLVGNIASTFPGQADFLSKLRATVAPGMSALRASRLATLENSHTAAVGNLRDNLARRRVLGSSFAQDALTRANLDYAQKADQVASDSFLQELDLSNQLSAAEFAARRGEFQTRLDELNLEKDTAVALAGGATQQMGINAQLKANLDAQNAAGAGKLFGTLAGPALDALSKGIGGAITGAFAPAAA